MLILPSRWMTRVGAVIVGSTPRMSYVRLITKRWGSWLWLVVVRAHWPGGGVAKGGGSGWWVVVVISYCPGGAAPRREAYWSEMLPEPHSVSYRVAM